MDLFNKAGIGVPANWEEFRAAAQALTDIDGGVYGLNVPGVPDFAIVFLLPLLAVGGTKLLSDDLLSVTANTEGGVAAFRALLEEIVYLDQSSTPLSFAPEQRRELGMSGRIAISWREQAGVKENLRVALPDTEFDTIPMLQLTADGQNAISSSTGLMFVAQQAAEKPAAFALLDFLASDEIQVDYVQQSVDLLPLKNGIPPPEDVDPLVAKMVSFLDAGYGVGSQASIHWREATGALVQEALAVMSGIKTAEQALADVEATVTPILDGE
jgi:ABC-type glycerol-3-phosphate transport system substrate-binding protein